MPFCVADVSFFTLHHACVFPLWMVGVPAGVCVFVYVFVVFDCLCCLCLSLSLSLSFYHIRVFSTADGGWVPAGGGVPSSFCLQSPKTDCGRKAFSQYCRQQAKSPTKAPSVSRYSRN